MATKPANKKTRSSKDVEVHVCRFIDYKPSTICAADLHPNNKHCAIGRENGNIEIWDLNGSFIERIIPGNGSNTVQSLLWINNTNNTHMKKSNALRLISSGLDGWLIEWDIETLSIKSKMSCNGYAIWNIAQSSNVQQNNKNNSNVTRISAACDDGKLRIFKLNSDEFSFTNQFTLSGRCLGTVWSSKQPHIVYGSTSNGLIFGFDTVSNQQIANIVVAPAAVHGVRKKSSNKMKKPLVWGLCSLYDYETGEEFIAGSTSRGSIDIFDVQFGTLIQSINASKNDIFSMKYVYNKDYNERILIAGCVDGRVLQLISKNNCDFVMTGYHRYHSHDVNVVSVTNEFVISGGIDTQLILCKTRDFWTHYVCSPLSYNNNSLGVIKIANDINGTIDLNNILPEMEMNGKLNNKLFLYQKIKELELWYMYGVNPIKIMNINVGFNNTNNILCSNICGNGKWIVVCNNHCIKLWKVVILNKSIKLLKIFETSKRGCSSVNFSKDNKYLFITPINMNKDVKMSDENDLKQNENDISEYLNEYKDKKANIIRINLENENNIIIDKEINIYKHIGNYMISSLELNNDSTLCSIIVPSLRYGTVIHIEYGKIFYEIPFGINNSNISCIRFQQNKMENKQIELLYVIYANNIIKIFYYEYCNDFKKIFKIKKNIRLHEWCPMNNKIWNVYNKNNPFSFTKIIFNPATINKVLLLRPEYMFSLIINKQLPNTYFPSVGSKRTFNMIQNNDNNNIKTIEQLIPSPFGKPQGGKDNKNYKNKKNKLSFLRVIRKYDPIMYAKFIDKNTLLLVHSPWHKVTASFKQPLYRKKYAI